ncbi:MAG: mandelate racemase/muconate lactonizing enzyme family protein [Candidatus Limnocylindria bacterium]
MKVRSIETWILRFPQNPEHRDYEGAEMELVGATVQTESGATGMGYTWTVNYGGAESIKALVDHVLAPRVIGREATEHPAIWQDLWWVTHRLGRGISMMALAAIDIALWDVVAKDQGVPLSKALGQAKEKVPTYSSGRASPILTKDELVEMSVDAVGRGFRAVKLRVGLDPASDLERIAAVREAVGPEVRIMCDANERLDLATAQWLGRRMIEHDVFWFEEPIPNEFVDGHRRLAEMLPMAIAVGEHLFSLWDFERYVDARAATVLEPDVCMLGGVTEWMRVADLALAHGLPVSPHFVPELHIHLAAAIQNSIYVESFPMMDDLLVHPLEVEDGQMLVPDRPGHGVELHDWVWEKYRVA